MEAVGELVVPGIRHDFAGSGIAFAGLVASEVGNAGRAIRDASIVELAIVDLVQERDLHLISESSAESWSGTDWKRSARNSRRCRCGLCRIPAAELPQVAGANVRYQILVGRELYDPAQLL